MFDVFRWKFPVGRVFGITVYVHLLFLLVLLPVTLSFCLDKDLAPGSWIDACTLAALATLKILTHEFGHSFAARWVGGESDEVMLWPLGGTAQVNFLPSTPRAYFITAAGGPLVDFVFCVVSALALSFCFDQSIRPQFNLFSSWSPFRSIADGTPFWHLTLWNGEAITTTSYGLMLVVWTFYVSWFLFLFNIILFGLPWDCGAMLRAVLWRYIGFHQATMYMITTGFICAAILFMAAFFFPRAPMCLGLAGYAFFMCYREWMLLESRSEELLFGYDFSQGYTSLEKDMPQTPARKKQNFIQRYLQQRRARKLQREQEQQEAEERRMDELLEKIQRLGKASLTDEETRFLKRVSDRYRNRH